jgi:hypothetical protein
VVHGDARIQVRCQPRRFPERLQGQFLTSDSRFCYFGSSDKVYVCHDWNYDTADFGYTLNVQAVSGSNPAQASRRIINN